MCWNIQFFTSRLVSLCIKFQFYAPRLLWLMSIQVRTHNLCILVRKRSSFTHFCHHQNGWKMFSRCFRVLLIAMETSGTEFCCLPAISLSHHQLPLLAMRKWVLNIFMYSDLHHSHSFGRVVDLIRNIQFKCDHCLWKLVLGSCYCQR